MSTSQEAVRLCTMCDSKGVLRCTKCRSVHYCSKECQQGDWPTHKLLCSSFSDFLVPPGPQFRRAILFPADEMTPKFVWVEITIEYDDYTGNWEHPMTNGLLGAGNPLEGRLYFRMNLLRKRELDTILELKFRDGFLIDRSLPNQSIIKVTKGDTAHRWAGPIIAFRKKDTSSLDASYDDITLSDFGHTVDYFRTYNRSDVTDKGSESCFYGDTFFSDFDHKVDDFPAYNKSEGTVKGVRISCNADERVLRKDKYIQVDVPYRDSVFTVDEPIGISRLIELPIFVRKYPPDQAWRNDPQFDNYDNQAATFLHLSVDTMSEFFGWASLRWQNEVGSVLAVRADRKPLSPNHMEALCYFCQFKMQPLFEDSMGAGFVERTRENVMGHMTRAKFEKFFTTYRAERMGDRSWKDTPSPYAV